MEYSIKSSPIGFNNVSGDVPVTVVCSIEWNFNSSIIKIDHSFLLNLINKRVVHNAPLVHYHVQFLITIIEMYCVSTYIISHRIIPEIPFFNGIPLFFSTSIIDIFDT